MSSLKPKGHIYKVYVEHVWGIDSILVTIKKRSVADARREGELRALRTRRGVDGPVKILDVVPMKYVAGKLTATRRMRVQKGKTVAARRPRTRVSVRATRRVAMSR